MKEQKSTREEEGEISGWTCAKAQQQEREGKEGGRGRGVSHFRITKNSCIGVAGLGVQS